MKILKVFIFSFLAIAFLLAGQSQVSAEQFYFLTPEQIGKPAPDFKLKNVAGNEVTLSQIRQGGKAIVFFWATWCPHCRRELKNLYDKRAAFAQQKITLAVIDLGEEAKVVKQYLEQQKMQDLDVILDAQQAYAEAYGIIGLPTLFFIDEQGNIRDVQHGLPDNVEKSFSQE